jgi:hypothetical protein
MPGTAQRTKGRDDDTKGPKAKQPITYQVLLLDRESAVNRAQASLLDNEDVTGNARAIPILPQIGSESKIASGSFSFDLTQPPDGNGFLSCHRSTSEVQ